MRGLVRRSPPPHLQGPGPQGRLPLFDFRTSATACCKEEWQSETPRETGELLVRLSPPTNVDPARLGSLLPPPPFLCFGGPRLRYVCDTLVSEDGSLSLICFSFFATPRLASSLLPSEPGVDCSFSLASRKGGVVGMASSLMNPPAPIRTSPVPVARPLKILVVADDGEEEDTSGLSRC